jgi:hypothetical protein
MICAFSQFTERELRIFCTFKLDILLKATPRREKKYGCRRYRASPADRSKGLTIVGCSAHRFRSILPVRVDEVSVEKGWPFLLKMKK